MEWLKDWLKPVLVIAAVGISATCTNQRFNRIDQRIIGIEKQLQVIDQRTFEMNTRLSRVEGKLDVTATVPNDQSPPEDPNK